MTDKRPALWLPITPKIFDDPKEAFNTLRLKARGFERIILKIHVTRGIVDWKCWTNLEKWQRKILTRFIKWHVRQSVRDTVEIYSGMPTLNVTNSMLWAEISPYLRAGAMRKLWLDTGSKEENRGNTVAMFNYYRDHQFVIGTEALGIKKSAWPEELDELPRICGWGYLFKHANHGSAVSGDDEVIIILKPDNKGDAPYPTTKIMQNLRDRGFTIAYSRNMATKLGIADDPFADDDEDGEDEG